MQIAVVESSNSTCMYKHEFLVSNA